MVDRGVLINNLENLFQTCFNKERYLLDKLHLRQNDIRVTFYKHLMNAIDPTIHFVIFTHKYLPEGKWWASIHKEYKIGPRIFADTEEGNYIKEFEYIDYHISFAYFHSIFNTFEHSIRTISLKCFSNNYYKQNNGKKHAPDFRNIFEFFLRQLRLWQNEYENFIEIVVKFRNSVHLNGIYYSPTETSHSTSGTKPPYVWHCKNYSFNHGEQIMVNDLWLTYIEFTYEFINTFDKIIIQSKIQDFTYIEDMTEPG